MRALDAGRTAAALAASSPQAGYGIFARRANGWSATTDVVRIVAVTRTTLRERPLDVHATWPCRIGAPGGASSRARRTRNGQENLRISRSPSARAPPPRRLLEPASGLRSPTRIAAPERTPRHLHPGWRDGSMPEMPATEEQRK
ncbi:hypothetical protein WMF18_19075 [Sorangium sp. So ce315]|uniref:hypothetical protein n=1 Tax=Sorangium sp. So ce315 TaxID=3133299 RepID=UPI003F646041